MCVSSEKRLIKGVVVPPHVPRTEGGVYWGYSVRLASCLSMALLTDSVTPLLSDSVTPPAQ